MKFQSNNLLESLSNMEITVLTKEVKETLHRNFEQPKKKFSPRPIYGIFIAKEKAFLKGGFIKSSSIATVLRERFAGDILGKVFW